MDWHRHAVGRDRSGVADLVRRLVAAVGPPVRGSRLLEPTADLLGRTREIESGVVGVPTVLRVGFQAASRFELQRDRYAALAASGTRVVAFGRGRPAPVPGVEWVALPADATALANQWFLVAREPDPIALVAFETDAVPGGGRRWEGFRSEDPRLVDEIAGHLDAVRDAADGTGPR